MNRHLDEGTLQALMDGELPHGERSAAEAHLAQCALCTGEMRALAGVHQRAAALLARADVPVPLAHAQMAMRARRAAARPRWHVGPAELLRAAVLVLGVAGVAAAAVPGTPVHAWIVNAVVPAPRAPLAPEHSQAPVVPAPAAAVPSDEPDPTAVSIRPEGGVVRVVLHHPAKGLSVTTRLTDLEKAEVYANGRAAAGARFRTAPGRIEVMDAGAGELVIGMPRVVDAAYVEVDGRVYVAKDGARLRAMAPARAEGAEGEPTFRVGS